MEDDIETVAKEIIGAADLSEEQSIKTIVLKKQYNQKFIDKLVEKLTDHFKNTIITIGISANFEQTNIVWIEYKN